MALYCTGGCNNCWNDGLIEHYNISADRWTTLQTHPPDTSLKMKDNIKSISINLCGYSSGFIYVTFYVFGDFVPPYKGPVFDQTVYVYNTLNNVWSTSETQFKRKAYQAVSCVVHG